MKDLGIKRSYIFVNYYVAIDYILEQGVENKIVLADEAHKLVIILKKLINTDIDKVMNVLFELKKVYKILLLTGTPIYSSEIDLIWLTNIAACKPLISLNNEEFIKNFYDISISKSIIYGWTQPFFASFIPLFILIFFGMFQPLVTYGTYGVEITEMYIQNPIAFASAAIFKELETQSISLLRSLEYKTLSGVSTDLNIKDIINLPGKEIFQVLKALHKIKNPPTNNYIETVIDYSKTTKTSLDIKSSQAFLGVYILPLLVLVILTIMALLIKSYNINEDRKLNTEKLTDIIGKYISIYQPLPTSSDFPTVYEQKIYVEYSTYQIQLWINFTTGQLSPCELYKLGVYDSIEKAELFRNITNLDKDVYLDKGRLIGNIENLDIIPNKFKEIYNIILKDKNPSVIIYSNFKRNGGDNIFKYLLHKGIISTLFTPELASDRRDSIMKDFYEKKIQVLILDPIFTEGLSFIGVTQLHILEPIPEKAKRDQVIGRAIRYKSHSHLPEKERNVYVYEWICTSKSITSFVDKNINKISSWFKKDVDIAYWKRSVSFDQSITPDEIAIFKQNELGNVTKKIIHNLKSNSIERTIPESTDTDLCCVWTPIFLECNKKPRCFDFDSKKLDGRKKKKKI